MEMLEISLEATSEVHGAGGEPRIIIDTFGGMGIAVAPAGSDDGWS